MNEKDIQQALCDLGYDSETIERAAPSVCRRRRAR